jgi:hypothetical protein
VEKSVEETGFLIFWGRAEVELSLEQKRRTTVKVCDTMSWYNRLSFEGK